MRSRTSKKKFIGSCDAKETVTKEATRRLGRSEFEGWMPSKDDAVASVALSRFAVYTRNSDSKEDKNDKSI